MSVEFDRGLPESLTRGLLIGKLLIGGLGVHDHGGFLIRESCVLDKIDEM